MAKSRKADKPARKRSTRTRKVAAPDAIVLLKADHRQVEKWFKEFAAARAEARKQDLARRICRALQVHTEIEHEIFYPAFLQATQDKDIHHEAEVEHQAAKKLIAEIERSSPADDYFEAKVTVLSEMIKHHVHEEEQRGGMFAEARSSRMDLKDLGKQLSSRKAALMSSPSSAAAESDAEGSSDKGLRGYGRGRHAGNRTPPAPVGR
jgi:hemerythrin superfamily protein